MNKKWLIALLVFMLILLGGIYYLYFFLTVRITEPYSMDFITLQPGYAIDIFADDLGPQKVSIPGPNNGVRMLEYSDGVFYASVPGKGEIVALFDKNNDWKIEKRTTFISGLLRPHGIAVHEDYVYIAAEDQVVRVKDTDKDGIAEMETLEKLVDLPPGTHWTRTVKIFDDTMYISIGSTCNVCREEHPWRAAIVQCELDGSNCGVFASGLRNAVDMEFHDGKIWATENGRDLVNNELPPDEINIIKEGKNYGWPICYGKNIHDTDFDKNVYVDDPCKFGVMESSIIDLQAHSAPIGLAFYDDDLLVAYHGSWNRNPLTGYKIVTIDLKTEQVEDFASGWLAEDGTVRGRPTDILIKDGSILVTDDVAGVIYRIYQK
ncbi:MAG: PQQ-dependent sugar dehydrogenase [Nanoarchaeota archaeon]|nr:PQQ-dependent sugar dehydrogenase [Nanoarchaeota archaeon]